MKKAIKEGLIRLSILVATACSPANSAVAEVGTPGSAATIHLTVFAAASLTESLTEIGQAFEAAHPNTHVAFNFAGSQQLAFQIQQGAQADVFAPADQHNMEKLAATGLIPSQKPVVWVYNQLVVILPQENPGHIHTLQDLARPGLKLVLADKQVPAGAYSRQVLENLSSDDRYEAGFKAAVLDNVVSNEENVKQVVAKVQLGEADAGIVYRSDVTPSLRDQLVQIHIPDDLNVRAEYPIVALEPQGQAFVRFVLTPQAQHILESWGFVPADQALNSAGETDLW
jgi:molybdate transport system substrate-binding protein